MEAYLVGRQKVGSTPITWTPERQLHEAGGLSWGQARGLDYLWSLRSDRWWGQKLQLWAKGGSQMA